MNKELIKKYKKEFDHWLNGGEIYVMFNNGSHKLVDSISDFNKDVKYIILKDCYFPYRKAEAEGKTIQYNAHVHPECSGIWKKYTLNDFHLKPNQYRIKPKDPEFKVGDWVRFRDIICQIKIVYNQENDLNGSYGLYINKGIRVIRPHLIELWQPKEGEWCKFYNENAKSFRVAQFNYIGFGKGKEGLYKDKQGNYFKYCEPYMNELPSTIKEVTNGK